MGKLFTLSEHHVAQKFHDLFVEFLNRFSDTSVDVRISALQCAKAVYVANPFGRESLEIICKLLNRYCFFKCLFMLYHLVLYSFFNALIISFSTGQFCF